MIKNNLTADASCYKISMNFFEVNHVNIFIKLSDNNNDDPYIRILKIQLVVES